MRKRTLGRMIWGIFLVVFGVIFAVNAVLEIPSTYRVGIEKKGLGVLVEPILGSIVFTASTVALGVVNILGKRWVDYFNLAFFCFIAICVMGAAFFPDIFFYLAFAAFGAAIVGLFYWRRHAVDSVDGRHQPIK